MDKRLSTLHNLPSGVFPPRGFVCKYCKSRPCICDDLTDIEERYGICLRADGDIEGQL